MRAFDTAFYYALLGDTWLSCVHKSNGIGNVSQLTFMKPIQSTFTLIRKLRRGILSRSSTLIVLRSSKDLYLILPRIWVQGEMVGTQLYRMMLGIRSELLGAQYPGWDIWNLSSMTIRGPGKFFFHFTVSPVELVCEYSSIHQPFLQQIVVRTR